MTKEFLLAYEELHPLLEYIDLIINKNHHIFLLEGDLASGKTSLIQKYISSKIPSCIVTSPTFSLVHEYNGYFHYDLYHHGLQKALELGLLDYLQNQGVHFIEWGDEKLANILKNSRYNYHIVKISKHANKRIYRIIDG
ncbi:tRNA (adenosine(37)-N6)-threonylcarbamoyltransferase complex ATPase subunit type 1 TsaE [Helicobacter anatolicus]|uniref:tRNA (adenosine(37)-N6)-threonylcarbamoyltransferase complex ATPase subunit type 1 TsaE n=1 Tax=Helicobacter anatolicus TaxID=2905874 RepID=UPI001E5B1D99|nr:tRNA (adenosine(37)-N6)-threonylcarbamoyltransferase complex ATPase subunit type 1 TsaE [Helicobacter anatolicus]MCE3040179.1 tRNA (adenosine(37)-N6)-threonylcarbamoyltransferase complex ATPase subunit type 1 TsaE [Helicobacter anatolicus]